MPEAVFANRAPLGILQYWNWFKYQDDLAKSPVFDGSDTSLSGDGEFFLHNGSMAANRTIYLPPGKGGGCVKSGPFQKYAPPLSFLQPLGHSTVSARKHRLIPVPAA